MGELEDTIMAAMIARDKDIASFCAKLVSAQAENERLREQLDTLSFPREYIPPGPEREAALSVIRSRADDAGRVDSVEAFVRHLCTREEKFFMQQPAEVNGVEIDFGKFPWERIVARFRAVLDAADRKVKQ